AVLCCAPALPLASGGRGARTAHAEDPPAPTPVPLPTAPPAPSPAQEPPAPSADPRAAAEGTGAVMRLHVTDAAAMGLARNLELAAGAYDPQIARATLCDAEGQFDPLLSVSVNAGRNESLPNQTFFGTDV